MDLNFKRYRDTISEAPLPNIPYLGAFLGDLTFLDEGNPSFFPDVPADGKPLVNYSKLQLLATAFRRFKSSQRTAFLIEALPAVQKMLVEVEVYDEKTLYELSLKYESRKASTIFANPDSSPSSP